ncbi:RnfABCDGE type electron transport complex subunit G [Lachnospira sp.]|jgi:electron transport complex protein RnfG|uniref:RnfABCDGE type electron transport complex subunit G n=1 Tax=Lachnospira sp. TaxID=2049031 RepID=UPI00257FBD2C|nr:RnfABCDGE type electron transport complex subunit G [Lachnospira sp.]
MGKIIKDASVLFIITLVAGVLLGLVYQVTKEPIAAQNEKAKQEAYETVLADASEFDVIYSEENADDAAYLSSLLEESTTDFSKDDISEVVKGTSNGETVGYVITVTAHDGYAGDIKFSVGLSVSGEYLGTSILSIGETAGLGMRAKTDPSFLNQFKGATTSEFSLVTDGTGSEAGDEIVDAISGSTVTSKAMTKAINAALVVFETINEGGNN